MLFDTIRLRGRAHGAHRPAVGGALGPAHRYGQAGVHATGRGGLGLPCPKRADSWARHLGRGRPAGGDRLPERAGAGPGNRVAIDGRGGGGAAATGRVDRALVTTNDNPRALSFYVRRDYRLVRVHLDAMHRVLRAKPQVPLTGKTASRCGTCGSCNVSCEVTLDGPATVGLQPHAINQLAHRLRWPAAVAGDVLL